MAIARCLSILHGGNTHSIIYLVALNGDIRPTVLGCFDPSIEVTLVLVAEIPANIAKSFLVPIYLFFLNYMVIIEEILVLFGVILPWKCFWKVGIITYHVF